MVVTMSSLIRDNHKQNDHTSGLKSVPFADCERVAIAVAVANAVAVAAACAANS